MKIFDFNGKRNGSFISAIDGSVGVPSGGYSWERTEKGLAWRGNGVDSLIAITTASYAIHTGAYSFEFCIKDIDKTGTRVILGTNAVSGFNFIRFSESVLQIESSVNGDSAQATITTNDNKWHHYIILCNAGIVSMYQDGVSLTMSNSDILNSITLNRIGATSSGFFNGDIGKIRIYNRILTEKERANLFSSFLNASPIVQSIEDNLVYPKPSSLENEPGLVAAYNMIPSPGGILTDISGNGNNGTIVGAVSSRDGMVFSNGHVFLGAGVFDGILGLSGTIAIRIHPEGINIGTFINFGGGYIVMKVVAGGGRIDALVYDGVDATFMQASTTPGKAIDMVMVWGGGIESLYLNGLFIESRALAAAPLLTGVNYFGVQVPGTSQYKGEISDPRIYNTAKDLQFASDHGVGSTI